MNHQGIEETDLVEAYVTDRLGPAQRAEFEAHLVDCPECLGRVEAAHGLLAGLHGLRDELPALPAPPATAARTRWLRRLGIGLAFAAALGAALLWGEGRARRVERALADEREARVTDQQKLEALSSRLAEIEAARAAERAAPAVAPGSVPVLSLMATRGTDLPTLALPASSVPAVLLVERESPPRFGRYRVTLRGPDGAEVMEQELAPSSREVVAVGLAPSVLRPGLHVLTIEGLSAEGGAAPVGRHRFQVVPAR